MPGSKHVFCLETLKALLADINNSSFFLEFIEVALQLAYTP